MAGPLEYQPFAPSIPKGAVPPQTATPAASAPAPVATASVVPYSPKPIDASTAAVATPEQVHDVATGHDLLQNSDGTIAVQDAQGRIYHVPPHEAGKLLKEGGSGYVPATFESLDEAHKQELWQKATFGEKSDAVARQIVVGIADGVALPVNVGATVGNYLAGGKGGVEATTGENLVYHLDKGMAEVLHALGADEGLTSEEIAQKSAQGARNFAGAHPVANMAAQGVGMLLGGELGAAGKVAALGKAGAEAATVANGAAKIAQGLGVNAANAAKIGKYAEQIALGAGIGLAAENENAWVNDEKLSAEAQMHALGVGALWGAGGEAALGLAGKGAGALSAKAAKVFGRTAPETTMGAEAAEELATSITGSKPSPTFADKLAGYRDMIRDRIETAQAKATGASLSDIQEVGALRNTARARRAQELYANREANLAEHATGLTESLKGMRSAGEDIYEEARSVELKRNNIKNLLKDTDHASVAQFSRAEAERLKTGLQGIEDNAELLGTGKATNNIVRSYKKAISALESASEPTDTFMALDQFKRETQKIKKFTSKTARNAGLPEDLEQATNRAQLMFDVSERARASLEDASLFGKAGEAQKAINSQMTEMLRSNGYVNSKLTEQVGSISHGMDFGLPNYQLSPDKVKSMVDRMGTNATKTLEDELRANIVSRRDLAQAMVDHYELGAPQAAKLKEVIAHADKSLEVLERAASDVGDLNKIDAIHVAQARNAGHGSVGAIIAGIAGHAAAGHAGAALAAGAWNKIAHIITQPGTMIEQAVAARHAVAKATAGIEAGIKGALSGARAATPAVRRVAQIASAKETSAAADAKYLRAVTALNRMQVDPEHQATSIGNLTAGLARPAMQAQATNAAVQAVGFLSSKVPTPLYANTVPVKGQDNYANISATQRDTFLAYADAVSNPTAFFKDLGDGSATRQQAETAQVLVPGLFAVAQRTAIEQFSNGNASASFQQRLKVQNLLGINIEPTTQPALQQFIAQTAQQQQQQAPQAPRPKSVGGGSAASASKSHLDSLKL